MKLFLLALALIGLSLLPSSSARTCDQVLGYTPACSGTGVRYTAFSKTPTNGPICLLWTDGTGTFARSVAFFPEVDEFSLLEIDGSKCSFLFVLSLVEVDLFRFLLVHAGSMFRPPLSLSLSSNTLSPPPPLSLSHFHLGSSGLDTTTDVQFIIQVGRQCSEPMDYTYQDSQSLTRQVPFFTAIVRLDDGVADEVVWDTGCFSCSGSDACRNGVCGFKTQIGQDCHENGDLDCDMKVYLGWIGVDNDGNHMTSAALRLSAFSQYSVVDIYNNAAKTASEETPTV